MLDALKPRHDGIHHLDGIGSGLLADLERNGIAAVQPGNAARFLDGVQDPADIPECDDRSAAVRDDDLVEILDVLNAPHGAQGDFRGSGQETSAGDFDILPLDGAADLIDGQAIGVHSVFVQQQLDFAMPVAGERDFADVLNGFEDLFDLLVDDLADLLLRPVSGNGDRKNGIRIRIHFLNDRRERVSRELVGNRRDLVPHILHCVLDLSLEDESDHDPGASLLGSGAQFIDPGDSIYNFLDRFGDLSLNLFGAGSGQAGLDDDHRKIRFGHQVQAELAVGSDAQHHDGCSHHESKYRASDADIRKLHGRPPRPLPARAPPGTGSAILF